MLGKSADFEKFPASDFGLTPLQSINTRVRLLRIGIIHPDKIGIRSNLTIGFQRAIVMFSEPLNVYHQIFGGIPAIHKESCL